MWAAGAGAGLPASRQCPPSTRPSARPLAGGVYLDVARHPRDRIRVGRSALCPGEGTEKAVTERQVGSCCEPFGYFLSPLQVLARTGGQLEGPRKSKDGALL